MSQVRPKWHFYAYLLNLITNKTALNTHINNTEIKLLKYPFVFSEDEFMDQVKTLANNLGFDAFCIPTMVTSTESSFNEREEY